jgi:hypothetical protein
LYKWCYPLFVNIAKKKGGVVFTFNITF